MPAGAVHDAHWRAGWLIVIPAAAGAVFVTSLLPLREHSSGFVGVGILAGYALQRYISPDADLIGVTTAEGLMINHFGVVGGFIFSYFSFYGYIFRKHHRSVWTHGPVISTAIRYVYMFWWPWREIYLSTWDLAWAVFMLVGAFLGTCIGDTLHWADDCLYKD